MTWSPGATSVSEPFPVSVSYQPYRERQRERISMLAGAGNRRLILSRDLVR